jgi:hypothetical protein
VKQIMILLPLAFSAGCQPEPIAPVEPKASREASRAVALRLQSIATEACECARASKEDQWWEPNPYPTKDYPETPPPQCWKKFAAALHPYRFDGAPVAACGPGSDTSGIALGRDRAFQGREGGWSVSDANGKIVEQHDPPKDRQLEIFDVQLHYGFRTCTPAQFAKAKADYEAESARPGCG